MFDVMILVIHLIGKMTDSHNAFGWFIIFGNRFVTAPDGWPIIEMG